MDSEIASTQKEKPWLQCWEEDRFLAAERAQDAPGASIRNFPVEVGLKECLSGRFPRQPVLQLKNSVSNAKSTTLLARAPVIKSTHCLHKPIIAVPGSAAVVHAW